eukprot:183480_1
MAVNALVIRNGIPVPVSREQFMHMDEGLSIEIGSHNDFKGKGKVYLTNYRLLFVKRGPSRKFSSFSMPYAHLIKHKYQKKLLGNPVISGTCRTIVNGGLHDDRAKFSITFTDANTAKAFYSLFEKEIQKFNQNKYNENSDRYKKILNTPSLSVEQIFPDQYASYKRSQTQQQNIVLKNTKKNSQIIVGQSASDAPMQLTHDYRAQKAKLFASNVSKSNVHGPISGASPVNVNAFSQYRTGKTVIQDETTRYAVPEPDHNVNQDVAAPASQYNAYVDPSNPDDIVLSVPINDNEFANDDEGKANANANGYMYDMGLNNNNNSGVLPPGVKQADAHSPKEEAPANAAVPFAVPVAVGVEDDEEDDFAQRPKVRAAVGNAKAQPQVQSAANDNNDNENENPFLINQVEVEFDLDNMFQVDDPWADPVNNNNLNDKLLPADQQGNNWE